MLRRSFLALMGAAIAAPLVSPLEAFVPPAVPVLAVEATVPYWLLELQAYQRLYNEAWSARMDRTLPPTPSGRTWTPTFPTHPLNP